jgi:hypothetical protein
MAHFMMLKLSNNRNIISFLPMLLVMAVIPLLSSCDEPETAYHSIVLSGTESILIGPHDSLEILNDGTWCFEIFFSLDTLIFPENRTLLSVVQGSQTVLSVSLLRDSVSYWHLLSPSDTLIRAVVTDPAWNNQFYLMALNLNYDESWIELWIDSTRIGTSSSYFTAIPDSGDQIFFEIGQDALDPTSLGWTGLIDECRLWDKALHSDLISFHRSNPSKLTVHFDQDEGDAGLIGIWRFNTNSGLLIPDEGRYGIDALIQSPSGTIPRSTHYTRPL